MENPNIWAVTVTKINQVINETNKKESIIEKDPPNSE